MTIALASLSLLLMLVSINYTLWRIVRALEAIAKVEGKWIGRLTVERTELLAVLKSCPCPGGGFNGMPKGVAATVALCVTHGVCGCTLGAAIAKAEGK